MPFLLLAASVASSEPRWCIFPASGVSLGFRVFQHKMPMFNSLTYKTPRVFKTWKTIFQYLKPCFDMFCQHVATFKTFKNPWNQPGFSLIQDYNPNMPHIQSDSTWFNQNLRGLKIPLYPCSTMQWTKKNVKDWNDQKKGLLFVSGRGNAPNPIIGVDYHLLSLLKLCCDMSYDTSLLREIHRQSCSTPRSMGCPASYACRMVWI